ncbi:GNAT family N-acetyltransferase [Catenulispora sp. NF23]|uniref:GNAT family N-acetyltransferase n=1 Tax=Catenulispora pinistramenti TaxID=2705254 RepID=UPI001BA4978F|nr:GNAT family protein [Catenulispora pinistramenti]MBS2539107.1 GNAT family N-acetyltransferase [Catenulispora pinistramenti]
MNPVTLEGPRLRFRELREDDIDALFAIYGSEVVTEHLSFDPRPLDSVVGIIASGIADRRVDPRTAYGLAVTLRTDSGLIGYARLTLEAHRAGQIGFALDPSVWGRGYGTETVQLLLQLGFDQLGLHRMWGARSPENAASSGAMSRNAMVEEARIRDHVFTHGAWRDSITHVILEDEWRAR